MLDFVMCGGRLLPDADTLTGGDSIANSSGNSIFVPEQLQCWIDSCHFNFWGITAAVLSCDGFLMVFLIRRGCAETMQVRSGTM